MDKYQSIELMRSLNKAVAIIILSVAFVSATISYKIGRSSGFDQGWDKGFIRGQSSAEPVNDDLSGEMYESGQDEREEAANKSKHPAAFMDGFDYAVQEMNNLQGGK